MLPENLLYNVRSVSAIPPKLHWVVRQTQISYVGVCTGLFWSTFRSGVAGEDIQLLKTNPTENKAVRRERWNRMFAPQIHVKDKTPTPPNPLQRVMEKEHHAGPRSTPKRNEILPTLLLEVSTPYIPMPGVGGLMLLTRDRDGFGTWRDGGRETSMFFSTQSAAHLCQISRV